MRKMGAKIIAILFCFFVVGTALFMAQDEKLIEVKPNVEAQKLVRIDSMSLYGDTKFMMRLIEIERNAKTSKLKLTYEKLGSAVGGSMFVVRGLYEVAKARGAEYFINLKEWDEPDGGHIYIVGFTNTKDANIHDEFGKEFTLTDDSGQARGYLSVSQCNLLWGDKVPPGR